MLLPYLPGKSDLEGEFKIVEVTTFVSVTTIPHLVDTIPWVSCCVRCVLDNKGNDVTKEGKYCEGDKEKIWDGEGDGDWDRKGVCEGVGECGVGVGEYEAEVVGKQLADVSTVIKGEI